MKWGVEIDSNKPEVKVRIPQDVDNAMTCFRKSPVFREVVEQEIRLRAQEVHGIEGRRITSYEIRGFLSYHGGETLIFEDEEELAMLGVIP